MFLNIELHFLPTYFSIEKIFYAKDFYDIYSCGQSYKASTSVNYNSTVVITSILLIFMTLDS